MVLDPEAEPGQALPLSVWPEQGRIVKGVRDAGESRLRLVRRRRPKRGRGAGERLPCTRGRPGRPARRPASALAAPRLSVVIPTRNEKANIEPLLERLERVLSGTDCEVLFVDDSDDGTPEVVERAAARSPLEVRLIHRSPADRQGGLGGAVVAGMALRWRPGSASWTPTSSTRRRRSSDSSRRRASASWTWSRRAACTSRARWATSVPCAQGSLAAVVAVGGAFLRRRLRGLTDPMSGFFLVRREAIDLDALEPRGFKILLEILVRTPGLASTRFRSSSGSGTQVTARHLCARAGAF